MYRHFIVLYDLYLSVGLYLFLFITQRVLFRDNKINV